MSVTLSITVCSQSSRKPYLVTKEMRVGRDTACDICINDPCISRKQLLLVPHSGRHAIEVQMNQDSSNALIHNGIPLMHSIIRAGESFSVGAYRFEVNATKSLGGSTRSDDPAGPIDIGPIIRPERIAPVWSPTATNTVTASPQSTTRLAVLSACVAMIGLALAATTFMRPPVEPSPLGTSATMPDLFAAIPSMDCPDPTSCQDRVRAAFSEAKKLAEGNVHDVRTLYKIARLLHRASHAPSGAGQGLPELNQSSERAKEELKSAYRQVRFGYELAVNAGDIQKQYSAVELLRVLCEEDAHRFCRSLELTYRSLREQLQIASSR